LMIRPVSWLSIHASSPAESPFQGWFVKAWDKLWKITGTGTGNIDNANKSFLWLDRSWFDILRLFTEQAFHCVATFPTFSNLRPTWCSILNIFQIKLLNLQRLQFYELGGKTIQALDRTYPWLELGQMHYFWKLSLKQNYLKLLLPAASQSAEINHTRNNWKIRWKPLRFNHPHQNWGIGWKSRR